MRFPLFLALAALSAAAADNSLTPSEEKAGWKLLFDGKTMKGWRDPFARKPKGDAWVIDNGTLKTVVKPRFAEDLVSAQSYGDFELQFDWRLSPGANTGLKYRLQRLVFMDDTKTKDGAGRFEDKLGREVDNPVSDRSNMAPGATGQEYTIGFELQLIDDKLHADARKDQKHTTGSLYSMIAPSGNPSRPAGEWNQGRLVVQGNHVEHWINGTKVVDASLDDPAVRDGIGKRWAQVASVYRILTEPKPRGPISLQHHGDEVWFRNLKIRPISR